MERKMHCFSIQVALKKSVSLEKLYVLLGGGKLLYLNAIMTSVVVFGFFRIISCLF